jgi:DNA-binding GntR family transcriptional regulator
MPIPKSVAQVVALLTDRITSKKPGYKPGDKLPTYEQLMDELPASRATLGRAIRELKNSGLLVGMRGGGVWVAERDE